MSTTITCPHCQKQVEITQALKHQLEAQISTEERQKFQQALRVERKKNQQAQELEQRKYRALLQQREQELEKNLAQKTQQIQEQSAKKLREQFDLTIKNLQAELHEKREQAQQQQEQLLEVNKTLRQLQLRDEQRQLEMERKMAEEQDKLRQQIRQNMDEEYRLKMLEKDKKMADVLKLNDELQRKLEQGSQQTQGEVLELELEQLLTTEFPADIIKEVPKGIRGADIIQQVCDRSGRVCGTILWESKNTKTFSPSWITKLKEDQRALKAEIAVLVSSILPDDIHRFTFHSGVWVTDRDSFLGLAHALRLNILQIHQAKLVSVGKHEKMELLYQYLSGSEFRHRVEGIVEAFSAMQQELEKEKRYFNLKWAKQEKYIRGVIDQTHGMYGDLQGIIGASLPQISSLQLEDGEYEEEIAISVEQTTETSNGLKTTTTNVQASLLDES